MLTQTDLFNAFGGEISKAAIRKRDGEWVVFGKWVIIAAIPDADYLDPESARWDVWICNPTSLTQGLSQRKVQAIVQARQEWGFTVLDGEAYTQEPRTEDILRNLKLLGIRRRRRISPEQALAATKRLNSIRSREVA